MKLVDEDLEYAFNPLLHVNPAKTTILVRFVIDKDAEYFDAGDLWNTDTPPYCTWWDTTTVCAVMNIDTSMNSEYRLATPFMPLDYVTNMPVRLRWRRSYPIPPSYNPAHDPPPYFPPWLHSLTKHTCLLYTSPSPRDRTRSRMPSSA